jgi:hypothetical protein
MSYEEDYYGYRPKDGIRLKKLYAKPGVHVPNKNEGKLLRKLMAESGLTEKQVREHKKYRKMLSDAQKDGTIAKQHIYDKRKKACLKQITKELKLAKEHPLVIEEFNKRWDFRLNREKRIY